MSLLEKFKLRCKYFKICFPNIAFSNFLYRLDGMLKHCHSILDVGCGANSPLSLLEGKDLFGIDLYKKNLQKAKKNKTHNKFLYMNARNIGKKFKEKSFDAVICLDLIEHLGKDDGVKLVKDAERLAKKKVIIFTTNGFLSQIGDGEDLETHLSGWTTKDFRNKGYQVYGLYGPKFLRDNKYSIVLRPKFFWGAVSEILNYSYCLYKPETSKALLCIKEIK